MTDHPTDPLPEPSPRRWDTIWMTLATQLARIEALIQAQGTEFRDLKAGHENLVGRVSVLEQQAAGDRARASQDERGRTGAKDRLQTLALVLSAIASLGALGAVLWSHG